MIYVVTLTLFLMIGSIIFVPKLYFFGRSISPYWVITALGTATLFYLQPTLISEFGQNLIQNTPINPLKILLLFLSFTAISIYLDEIGLIAYIAARTVRFAGNDQQKLFFYFYILVAFLTVFTANDIVILTLTPFIIYFAKNAKINPLPFVVMQFVAANTWSMLLIIGNPTNIYIATSFGIDFISYFYVMALPTFLTGLASYFLLVLIFRFYLKQKIEHQSVAKNPPWLLVWVGLIHLGGVTLLMAVAPYLGIEMFLVALGFAISLFFFHSVFSFGKKSFFILLQTLKRLPWSLVPFFLSMVVFILVFEQQGLLTWFYNQIQTFHNEWLYGFASFLVSNIINNIPMSILFSNMLALGSTTVSLEAVYASIIGSNLGAIFTPIGALAGMMWMSILKFHAIPMKFTDFLRYGFLIGFPLLAISLFGLQFVV